MYDPSDEEGNEFPMSYAQTIHNKDTEVIEVPISTRVQPQELIHPVIHRDEERPYSSGLPNPLAVKSTNRNIAISGEELEVEGLRPHHLTGRAEIPAPFLLHGVQLSQKGTELELGPIAAGEYKKVERIVSMGMQHLVFSDGQILCYSTTVTNRNREGVVPVIRGLIPSNGLDFEFPKSFKGAVVVGRAPYYICANGHPSVETEQVHVGTTKYTNFKFSGIPKWLVGTYNREPDYLDLCATRRVDTVVGICAIPAQILANCGLADPEMTHTVSGIEWTFFNPLDPVYYRNHYLRLYCNKFVLNPSLASAVGTPAIQPASALVFRALAGQVVLGKDPNVAAPDPKKAPVFGACVATVMAASMKMIVDNCITFSHAQVSRTVTPTTDPLGFGGGGLGPPIGGSGIGIGGSSITPVVPGMGTGLSITKTLTNSTAMRNLSTIMRSVGAEAARDRELVLPMFNDPIVTFDVQSSIFTPAQIIANIVAILGTLLLCGFALNLVINYCTFRSQYSGTKRPNVSALLSTTVVGVLLWINSFAVPREKTEEETGLFSCAEKSDLLDGYSTIEIQYHHTAQDTKLSRFMMTHMANMRFADKGLLYCLQNTANDSASTMASLFAGAHTLLAAMVSSDTSITLRIQLLFMLFMSQVRIPFVDASTVHMDSANPLAPHVKGSISLWHASLATSAALIAFAQGQAFRRYLTLNGKNTRPTAQGKPPKGGTVAKALLLVTMLALASLTGASALTEIFESCRGEFSMSTDDLKIEGALLGAFNLISTASTYAHPIDGTIVSLHSGTPELCKGYRTARIQPNQPGPEFEGDSSYTLFTRVTGAQDLHFNLNDVKSMTVSEVCEKPGYAEDLGLPAVQIVLAHGIVPGQESNGDSCVYLTGVSGFAALHEVRSSTPTVVQPNVSLVSKVTDATPFGTTANVLAYDVDDSIGRCQWISHNEVTNAVQCVKDIYVGTLGSAVKGSMFSLQLPYQYIRMSADDIYQHSLTQNALHDYCGLSDKMCQCENRNCLQSSGIQRLQVTNPESDSWKIASVTASHPGIDPLVFALQAPVSRLRVHTWSSPDWYEQSSTNWLGSRSYGFLGCSEASFDDKDDLDLNTWVRKKFCTKGNDWCNNRDFRVGTRYTVYTGSEYAIPSISDAPPRLPIMPETRLGFTLRVAADAKRCSVTILDTDITTFTNGLKLNCTYDQIEVNETSFRCTRVCFIGNETCETSWKTLVLLPLVRNILVQTFNFKITDSPEVVPVAPIKFEIKPSGSESVFGDWGTGFSSSVAGTILTTFGGILTGEITFLGLSIWWWLAIFAVIGAGVLILKFVYFDKNMMMPSSCMATPPSGDMFSLLEANRKVSNEQWSHSLAAVEESHKRRTSKKKKKRQAQSESSETD